MLSGRPLGLRQPHPLSANPSSAPSGAIVSMGPRIQSPRVMMAFRALRAHSAPHQGHLRTSLRRRGNFIPRAPADSAISSVPPLSPPSPLPHLPSPSPLWGASLGLRGCLRSDTWQNARGSVRASSSGTPETSTGAAPPAVTSHSVTSEAGSSTASAPVTSHSDASSGKGGGIPTSAAGAPLLQWPSRTDFCGTLGAGDEGKAVTLCGWVAAQRRLGGGVTFATLRDHTGIVQVLIRVFGFSGLLGFI